MPANGIRFANITLFPRFPQNYAKLFNPISEIVTDAAKIHIMS